MFSLIDDVNEDHCQSSCYGSNTPDTGIFGGPLGTKVVLIGVLVVNLEGGGGRRRSGWARNVGRTRGTYLDTEDKSNDGKDESWPAATTEQGEEGEGKVVGRFDGRPSHLPRLTNLEISIACLHCYWNVQRMQP